MNIEPAARRYRRASRVAEGFARGKMKGDPVYAAVLSRLHEGGTLLDVGCGEGYLLALATEQGAGTLVGLDHDARRLALGQTALNDVADCRLISGDVRTAELPQADVITCLDVLHYQAPDEQDAILVRLADALRPGGVLFVRDASSGQGLWSAITALSERVAVAIGRHLGDGVFFRAPGELEAAMRAAGLEVTTEDCSAGTPFSNVLYTGRRP